MPALPYDASRQSLFHPGAADDFFQLGDYSGDDALCAEMARLAYVKEDARLEQYLARANFQKAQAIGYENNGTQVFIATKRDQPLTVVAFRGSEPEDQSDIFADAEFILTRWQDASGRSLGEVHGGFARYSADNDIFNRVKAHLDTLPHDHRVLITGHSLGAALATLLASWAPSAHLYMFGSPRVGNGAFAQSVRNSVAVRFVNCCDVVTRLPPKRVLDYADTGRLAYIDRSGARLARIMHQGRSLAA